MLMLSEYEDWRFALDHADEGHLLAMTEKRLEVAWVPEAQRNTELVSWGYQTKMDCGDNPCGSK